MFDETKPYSIDVNAQNLKHGAQLVCTIVLT